MATEITVAYGDGIGPEIMEATLGVLEKAGAALKIEVIEVGEKIYLRGHATGIEPSAWDSIRKTKILLKAPITTPQGGGMKSINVTMRKTLGLYANVRPCVAYAPFVETKHPDMDVVIIRENEEDLYTGTEYRQSHDTVHALKLVTRPASEKIIRYAFEYAVVHGRRRVTCFTKDNILKMSDGFFRKIFEEIAAEYPSIQHDSYIIDIGTARLADEPERFDVIVLQNLYGDILSDVAAQVAGSVGLAGSANIGTEAAMFEAIHGSAPDIAGKGIANPSGLLHGAIMMLLHIGQADVAEKIHNAWLRTIEDGVHTADIFKEKNSKQKVFTKEFAQAVIERLGQKPQQLKPAKYSLNKQKSFSEKTFISQERKELVGVDVWIEVEPNDPIQLSEQLKKLEGNDLVLENISSRGLSVWPNTPEISLLTNVFQCRFCSKQAIGHADVVALLEGIVKNNFVFHQAQLLYNFEGKPGFTRSQGQ